MQTTIPNKSNVLRSLMRADFTTQWRNRKSAVLTLVVPIIILISWKGIIDKVGGAFALSTAITIGLVAIGLMGYTNSIARDRDKGIFQRLRVAPISSASIMMSRLSVQLVMIMILTLFVFATGYFYDGIQISFEGYLLGFLAAIVGGAVYLGLGQVIVGLIKNPETVNSTSRLIYFAFIVIGMLGELGALGDSLKKMAIWSPYGTVQTILKGSFEPSSWNHNNTLALGFTIAYALVFAFLGIRRFQWNSR